MHFFPMVSYEYIPSSNLSRDKHRVATETLIILLKNKR